MPEPGAALGQHVQGGDQLGQHSRLPVADRGHPGQQLHLRGARGQVAQRGVGLQHVVLGRADHLDLPDVVHHADPGEALLLGLGGDPGQVVGQPGCAGRKGEVRDVQTDLHSVLPRCPSTAGPISNLARSPGRRGRSDRRDQRRSDIRHERATNRAAGRNVGPVSGSEYEVVLLRHGETVGYDGDLGLTARGEQQARDRGAALAAEIKPGSTVRMPHARTARAIATAVTLRAALVETLGGERVDGTEIGPLYPEPWFDNLRYSLHGAGGGHRPTRWPPGWPGAASRRTGCASTTGSTATTGPSRPPGNPIEYWLHNPTLYFEPPQVAAHRIWRGVAAVGRDGRSSWWCWWPRTPPRCARSWPPRWATDPGEPDNLEDVRVRVRPDRSADRHFPRPRDPHPAPGAAAAVDRPRLVRVLRPLSPGRGPTRAAVGAAPEGRVGRLRSWARRAATGRPHRDGSRYRCGAGWRRTCRPCTSRWPRRAPSTPPPGAARSCRCR